RLLVMQKLQILLGLPEKISPSYLFTQQVELPIEVSKKSTIEGLSETAIIIRNPVPLKAEVNSHIYFTIPEGMPYAGTVFNIYGKTFHSEPHPELPNCYLVYISFFGMSRDLSTKLRAILNRVPRYQYFKNSEIDDFQFDPRNIFVTEDQKKIRNIVVLDLERQQAVTTAETLKREIGNIECFACNSYFRFSEAHFVSDSDREMGQPARQSDFPAPEVVFTITSENWDLKIPPSNLAATDEFLGHNVATLFAQPDAWRKLFEDLYHANILSETLRAAELEKMLKTEIEAQHANGQSLVLNLEATQKSDGLELIFRPPMAQSERGKFKTPLSRIDAIVINSHLIPTDVEGWLERLTEKIKDSRLNTRIPKIIIMADSNETDLSPIRCLNLPFYAYIDYPINPKQLVFSVTQATGSTFSRYTVSNLRYADLRIPVFLAKHALLEGLSEFGASIRLAQPLADGALLYLHGAIFDSAPGGHLAARFYLTEPHPENKNYFKCHFLYYAITDAFLKYTRNYIREQYTSGKTEAAP
ncbi:MAG: hypothetical protein KDD61_10810, partial [Bdellovibrionales bacterium]|nr:hypothetical protein [Bdellovibrionales bacterium]